MIFLENIKPLYHERYWINKLDKIPETELAFYAFLDSEIYPGYTNKREEAGHFFAVDIFLNGKEESITSAGKKISTPGTFILASRDDRYCHMRVLGKETLKRKVILLYKNDFARKFISLFFPEGHINVHFEEFSHLRELFDRIKNEFVREGELDVPVVSGIFTELLQYVNSRQEKNQFPILVNKSLAFIENNLFDPGLCREDIASNLSISLSYLDKLFRKNLQKSVNEYITGKRLQQVTRLLSLPHLRTKEIAASSGFSSSIYMDRLFRKKYGMTPTQYRKKLPEKREVFQEK